MRDDGHFFVFTEGKVDAVALRLSDFFRDAEAGNAMTRLDATAERLEAAHAPFDPKLVPEWTGPTILAVILLLTIATLGSEDLTCLGAGLLVAQGRLALMPAVLGCLIGIVIGDLLLFMAGRIFGRRLVRLAPFRWWISEERLVESSAWLRKRGLFVILLSRFTPGARLPTYFAAGVLDTRLRHFLVYFVVAASLWTPLVVGLSSRLGDTALERWSRLQGGILLVAALLLLCFVLVQRILIPMSTRRGRKKLQGQFKRLRHYEFWPSWALYLPVVAYMLWLGVRHRGLTLFSAANPAIPAGGLVGESKAEILTGLADSGRVPTWQVLPAAQPNRARAALEFARQHDLGYPLVLKPDSGERWSEVLIANADDEIERYFEAPRGDTLVQRYVPGAEYGVFYYRYLDQTDGQILSICKKTSPTVVGDGERTLEQLILDDPRAVAIAHVYLREVANRKNEVPAVGTVVSLTDIGAHSRGMIFEEGSHLVTEALVAEVDRISKSYDGFDFGRFDFRVPHEQDLLAGRNLAIIELNGVTSESTNLYDRRYSVFQAWWILCRQWRIAYQIGAQRRDAGDPPATPLQLWHLWREAR
jgi:membrane protein DedA with SNARE-associated domain